MEDWNFFSENEYGRPADVNELLQRITQMIDEHELSPQEAIDIVIDMVRPGNSPNSHDVKAMWMGAMYAFGFPEVAEKISSMWLNILPWGVGFAIAVEPDFNFHALSEPAQRAVMESMAILLRVGGMNVTIGADKTMLITDDRGMTEKMNVESIISEFRAQLDDELGPDAPPNPNDPTKRWMP